jgi:hypothetical protein
MIQTNRLISPIFLLCLLAVIVGCDTTRLFRASENFLDTNELVSEKPLARINPFNFEFIETTRVYDRWQKLDSYASESDVIDLSTSLKNNLSRAQSSTIELDLPYNWHLYPVIRTYMQVYHGSGDGEILTCIAWCLTDEDQNVLYHEQFYTVNLRHMYNFGKSIGAFKTDANYSIVRRIVRRVFVLAALPDKITFDEADDPNTYDTFTKAYSQLPPFEVWKDLQFEGTEIIGQSSYEVYRLSEQLPGWESTQKTDFIDWEAYLSKKHSTG